MYRLLRGAPWWVKLPLYVVLALPLIRIDILTLWADPTPLGRIGVLTLYAIGIWTFVGINVGLEKLFETNVDSVPVLPWS